VPCLFAGGMVATVLLPPDVARVRTNLDQSIRRARAAEAKFDRMVRPSNELAALFGLMARSVRKAQANFADYCRRFFPGWVEIEIPGHRRRDEPTSHLGSQRSPRRNPGGRPKLWWDEIRDAYDGLPAELRERLAGERLYRRLDKSLTEDGIFVSHATMARALAGRRILCKT
jgi:hypothetical protein